MCVSGFLVCKHSHTFLAIKWEKNMVTLLPILVSTKHQGYAEVGFFIQLLPKIPTSIEFSTNVQTVLECTHVQHLSHSEPPKIGACPKLFILFKNPLTSFTTTENSVARSNIHMTSLLSCCCTTKLGGMADSWTTNISCISYILCILQSKSSPV